MKAVFSRVIQTLGSILVLAGALTFPIAAIASEATDTPLEDWPKILLFEIQQYVTSSGDPAQFRTKFTGDARVAYAGFSPEAIAKNASAFPDIAEYAVAHLPYGRKDYYDFPLTPTDYWWPNTLTVFNVDLAVALAPPEDGPMHIGKFLYAVMRPYKQDTVVEFGPPMEQFRDAPFPLRNALLDETCTSVSEFVEDNEGNILSRLMILYSAAEPGSEEQVRCLKMQALVFMKPASVPFSTALD